MVRILYKFGSDILLFILMECLPKYILIFHIISFCNYLAYKISYQYNHICYDLINVINELRIVCGELPHH